MKNGIQPISPEILQSVIQLIEKFLASPTDKLPVYSEIPEAGLLEQEIADYVEVMRNSEKPRWEKGFASGAVYHGGGDHIDFLNKIYALSSQANQLHPDLWPSITKCEAEIVIMAANMLGAKKTKDEICGTVTSGGTESILLAMKAYRDWARSEKGITEPEIVAPSTAHVAFDKAAQYFNIKIIRVPVTSDFTADVGEMKKAITDKTIVIVGSSPPFPHGVIDPIKELSELAGEKDIGFHTDACLGGFLLPWLEKLGYPVPPFDFRLPGVTSISADTHKYGYAPKGTSVILYRNQELCHHQYFAASDWPGGLYFSSTIAGSRPGALVAACWAAMLKMGERGYMAAAKKIIEAATDIRQGIEAIPELRILGNPIWVIAFSSKTENINIYTVFDQMTRRGWSLNALQRPPAIHICVTLRHAGKDVAKRLIDDLKISVKYAKEHPGEMEGMAPIYGIAAALSEEEEAKETMETVLKNVVDLLYKVKK